MAKFRTTHTASVGGVVVRPGNLPGHIQVALVGRITTKGEATQRRRSKASPSPTPTMLWALPKGTPRAGETPEQTALREVREETGLEARILAPVDTIEYWFVLRGVRYHKSVQYFLMEATGGDTALHDTEYDVSAWFDAEQALALMSYPNEREMIERALELLKRDGGVASLDLAASQ